MKLHWRKQTLSWLVLLQVSEIWSLASFTKHANEVESSTCSMNTNKDREIYRVTEQAHPCYWMELEFMDEMKI
jgi:hypothetical protein